MKNSDNMGRPYKQTTVLHFLTSSFALLPKTSASAFILTRPIIKSVGCWPCRRPCPRGYTYTVWAFRRAKLPRPLEPAVLSGGVGSPSSWMGYSSCGRPRHHLSALLHAEADCTGKTQTSVSISYSTIKERAVLTPITAASVCGDEVCQRLVPHLLHIIFPKDERLMPKWYSKMIFVSNVGYGTHCTI